MHFGKEETAKLFLKNFEEQLEQVKETNKYKITRDYEFEDKSELVFGKDKRRYRRELERKIKGKKKFGFK